MNMTREQAVYQLRDLRDHCRSMISGDNDYPEWALDVEALDMAIAALRPVSREKMERIRGEWKICFEDWRQQIAGDQCSKCGFQHYGTSISQYKFCPNCGAPMTDEAVDIELRRWKEAVRRG